VRCPYCYILLPWSVNKAKQPFYRSSNKRIYQNTEHNAQPRNSRWWTWVVVIVVLLAIGGGLFYFLHNSGPSKMNNSASSSSADTNKILMSCSYRTTKLIGTYNKPNAGKTFLVVTVTIKNQGYYEFRVYNSSFIIESNNIRYGHIFLTGLTTELQEVTLLNGGQISGDLAFEVPEGISPSDIKIGYKAQSGYNIEWVK